MLFINHDTATGQVRLIIRNPFAKAWIMHYPRLTEDFRHVEEPHDWRLYVRRASQRLPSAGKSPTRLLIESRLRAWLLQRFRRRLSDLRFAELCAIAQRLQKYPSQERRVEGRYKG